MTYLLSMIQHSLFGPVVTTVLIVLYFAIILFIALTHEHEAWGFKHGGIKHLCCNAKDHDAMLERTQALEARAGMRAAFNASPEELGRAAVAYSKALQERSDDLMPRQGPGWGVACHWPRCTYTTGWQHRCASDATKAMDNHIKMIHVNPVVIPPL
jgi:hypothetical protein